jgi:hypothetical protein
VTGRPLSLSRGAFLRGLAAAGAGAALGPNLLAPTALAQAPGGPASVLDLHFTVAEQFRPFALIGERFRQVRLRLGGGAARQDAGGGLFKTGVRPVAPFASVIADVGATPAGAVLVGLVRDPAHHVVAVFDAGTDPVNGTVAIEVTAGGVTTRVAEGTADLRGPVRLAFSVQENYVTALVGRVASWTPIVQFRVTELVDLRDPDVLRTYDYGFGARGDGVVALTGLEAGYFGQVGLRDPHVVQFADGRPYIRNGKLYFTATQAGLSFFQAAHWGVWTMDLDDVTRIEQVANLFFARDGLVVGDHAGQVVVDRRDGGFHVAMSSWGTFDFTGVQVRYAHTFEDVLRGVHVIPTEPLPLPTDVSSWDPAMTRIGDRWYVGFVESPYQVPGDFDFHPALARSAPGGSLLELERVGADLTRGETEGIILQRVGRQWTLLASDGDLRAYPVYDLSMNLLGYLDAPYGTNIPHPQVVPVPDGAGGTTWLLITFDGTQFYEPVLGYGTHGDLIVMRASG